MTFPTFDSSHCPKTSFRFLSTIFFSDIVNYIVYWLAPAEVYSATLEPESIKWPLTFTYSRGLQCVETCIDKGYSANRSQKSAAPSWIWQPCVEMSVFKCCLQFWLHCGVIGRWLYCRLTLQTEQSEKITFEATVSKSDVDVITLGKEGTYDVLNTRKRVPTKVPWSMKGRFRSKNYCSIVAHKWGSDTNGLKPSPTKSGEDDENQFGIFLLCLYKR